MEAIISAADQAAWAGKSLVDATMPQRPHTVILRNPVANVRVAGISDLPRDRLVTIINRGPFDVTLMANDAAAPAPWRFSAEKAIPAGKKSSLFYSELGISSFMGKEVIRAVPVAGNVGSAALSSLAAIGWNHTTVAGDNLLVVALSYRSSFAPSGVTFNGVAMSALVPNLFVQTGAQFAVFYLVDPPVGTFAVNCTFASTGFLQCEGMSVSVKDADPASPFGPVASAGVNGAGTTSCSPPTSLGQLVLGVGGRYCSPANPFNPPTAPEVELANVPGASPIHHSNLTQRPSAAGSSLLVRSATNATWVLGVLGFGIKGKPI